MHLKKCDILSFRGIILVRADLNLSETNIAQLLHHPRVLAISRLVTELCKNSNIYKIIIMSHRGRPEGFDEKLSLKPLVSMLEMACGCEITFMPGAVLPTLRKIRNTDSRVILLDNLRFHTGELENDSSFAESLSNLGDIYINNAFSVVHRNHASVAAITEQIPFYSYAGPSLIHEVHMLERLIGDSAVSPFMVILGGAKLEDKLPLALQMAVLADVIAVGGMLGYDSNSLIQLKKACAQYGTKLIVPLDYIKDGKSVADIGPQTISVICQEIKNSNTVFWNGPVGRFETPGFAQGTISIADCLNEEFKSRSDLGFSSVIGGGDTVIAFEGKKATFISTGGGAATEFSVKGYDLPGLRHLVID